MHYAKPAHLLLCLRCEDCSKRYKAMWRQVLKSFQTELLDHECITLDEEITTFRTLLFHTCNSLCGQVRSRGPRWQLDSCRPFVSAIEHCQQVRHSANTFPALENNLQNPTVSDHNACVSLLFCPRWQPVLNKTKYVCAWEQWPNAQPLWSSKRKRRGSIYAKVDGCWNLPRINLNLPWSIKSQMRNIPYLCFDMRAISSVRIDTSWHRNDVDYLYRGQYGSRGSLSAIHSSM